jgi:hypothetical protein
MFTESCFATFVGNGLPFLGCPEVVSLRGAAKEGKLGEMLLPLIVP